SLHHLHTGLTPNAGVAVQPGLIRSSSSMPSSYDETVPTTSGPKQARCYQELGMGARTTSLTRSSRKGSPDTGRRGCLFPIPWRMLDVRDNSDIRTMVQGRVPSNEPLQPHAWPCNL